MTGIWANFGLDFAAFQIFYPNFSVFIAKLCLFVTLYIHTGVVKKVQYAPGSTYNYTLPAKRACHYDLCPHINRRHNSYKLQKARRD